MKKIINSKKITTVLFDFDGTIMNTNEIVIKSWQHTYRTVKGEELPAERIVKTFGEPLYITMARLFPQIAPETGIEIYRSYLREHYAFMIKPFPGMVDLVIEVKERGYKTGLVTSRVKDTTVSGLVQFGLYSHMDCLVTCEDTDKHKPDPEPIKIALGKLSANPDETIMLGDTMFDIICARNAGVKSALVGWQMALDEEEINGSNGPDFLVEKPRDLFDII